MKKFIEFGRSYKGFPDYRSEEGPDMSKESLNVYRATATELEALVPLFDGYRVFYKQASDYEAARSFLGSRLAKNDTVIFLAELDGKAVGFTQLLPSFSSVLVGRLWILNDLFVVPEARRGGVARALLGRARDYALKTQAKRLVLRTAVDNRAAQSLYEALGWTKDEAFYTYNLTV